MKNINKIALIAKRVNFLDNLASNLRLAAGPKTEEYVFCFHPHMAGLTFGVWPFGQDHDGEKYCELIIIDTELKLCEWRGFGETELAEIYKILWNYLEESN